MSSEVVFKAQFQADLLSAMLTHPDRFRSARKIVKPESFTIPELQWLFSLADSVYESSGELPSSGLVAQEASAHFAAEGEFETLIEVHHDLMQGRPAPKEILASAVKFAEDSNYRSIARKHDKLIELGKFSEAKELMEQQGWKVEDQSAERRRMMHGWNDVDAVLERAKARRDDPDAFKFKTDIADLDALMKGGYRRQHMVLVIGWTGRGKSTVSVNLSSTNVRNGFPGVYLSSEMTVDEIFAKMIARETMTAYDIIYEYGFDGLQEERFLNQIRHKQEHLRDKLYIEQTGIHGTNRASITQALDDASEFFGEAPSWCVMDTLDHCEANQFKKKNEAMADNINWFAAVLEEYDMAGIVTTQANRDGSGETDESHAANTIESARVAPWIIAVNETDGASRPDPHADVDALLQPREVYQSKTLSLVKARFGRKGDVPVSANLECSFIGDLHIENSMQ